MYTKVRSDIIKCKAYLNLSLERNTPSIVLVRSIAITSNFVLVLVNGFIVAVPIARNISVPMFFNKI